MKTPILIGLACLAAHGCTPKSDSQPEAKTPATPPAASKPTAMSGQASQSGSGDSGAIAPIGPNIGGMTPVSGGENLGGGTGGGVGQMAKDQARKAAGQAGAPAGTGDGSE